MKFSDNSLKRLFIGIPVPVNSRVESSYITIQNKLDNILVANWTSLAQWHLTLHFFGEIFSNHVPAIINCMEKSFNGFSVQQIVIKKPGYFGNMNNPRVLWFGLEPVDEIIHYQMILARTLSEQGFHVENRPFSPHLTLARIKKVKDIKKFQLFVEEFTSFMLGGVVLEKVVLYESLLSSRGPTYIPLHIYHLKTRKQ